MTRRAYDETEAMRTATRPAVEELPLFAPQAPTPITEEWTDTRWASLTDDERRAQRARWCERLEPLLRAMLAQRPHEHGVTAAELVDEAMRPRECTGFGVILPEGLRAAHPKVFAFVGPWLAVLARRGAIVPKTAALEGHGRIHLKREAVRNEAHGNSGFIYTRPAREQAA